MQKNQNYQQLAETFKSASTLLDINSKSALHLDIISICNYLTNPKFRIAIFGPFNHGKSTLLNAILGSRALPIDLISTTSATITIKYGTELRTKINLKDNTAIYRNGTEVLKEFANLNGNKRIQSNVTSVEIFCPHPFLYTGVEFIDLPGINYKEEQDKFVYEQLLSADLLVILLDARKLMTLCERDSLRDWLLNCGIKTVIFVVNFLNLLKPDEQKEVQNCLRFVAESFRSDLPSGFSNLYRVDALPALTAKLKGDSAAVNASGLVAFETALQNMIVILQQNYRDACLPRVQAIASQIQTLLHLKIANLINEIKDLEAKNNAKHEIKKRAEQLITQGFHTSVVTLRNFLSIKNLRDKYQVEAAIALAGNKFKYWETNILRKDFNQLILEILKCLNQAYNFFHQEKPEILLIPFPKEPQVILPLKQNNFEDLNETGSLAVCSGIGWFLGGQVRTAVVGNMTYLVNRNLQQKDEKIAKESYHQQIARICVAAVDDYLKDFSNQGLSILDKYEKKAENIIRFVVSPEPVEITRKRENLQQLQNILNRLYREIEKTLGIAIPCELYIESGITKHKQMQ